MRTNTFFVLALSIGIPIHAQGACDEPSFGDVMGADTQDAPLAVALGDFDGDQQLDLAVTGSVGLDISLGNVDGTFGPASTVFTGGVGAAYLEAGDMNGDGLDDLVVPNEFSSTFAVLLANGSGGFANAVTYQVAAGPRSIALGDLDDDGDLDVAVVSPQSDVVASYTNNGFGSLTLAGSAFFGDSPQAAVFADLSADGVLDLVVANDSDSSVTVRAGDGSGQFGPIGIIPMGGPARWLDVGDFDGDGQLDVVACITGAENVVNVVRRTPIGGFLAPETAAFSTAPRSVVAADLDFDGDLDLFIVNDQSFPVGALVLEGDGNGNFSSSETFPFIAGSDADVGDLDANGTLDLVFPAFQIDRLEVALSGCVPRPGTTEGLVLASTTTRAGMPTALLPFDPIKEVAVGDALEIQIGSVTSVFDGTLSLVYVQLQEPSAVPPPFVAFPGLHLNPLASPAPFLSFAGVHLPQAILLSTSLPSEVLGLSILIQGFAIAPSVAGNGLFASSPAHELIVSAP